MKMETKKLAATFAILMLALGIAGFAYAHWEKIITIDGTVTTGTFHLTPSFNAEPIQDKDVATVSSSIDGNTVTVTFENVYPCLTINGMFDLTNDGTIPASPYRINYTDSTGTYSACPVPDDPEPFFDEHFPDWMTFTITGWEGDFDQIDPGQTAVCYFTIHFEEETPQGLTGDKAYWFTITFEYWNWNEVELGPQP